MSTDSKASPESLPQQDRAPQQGSNSPSHSHAPIHQSIAIPQAHSSSQNGQVAVESSKIREIREYSLIEASPQQIEVFGNRFDRIASNVETVIQGKRDVVELVVLALVAEGHVLVEDVPGVGKTQLAKSIARSIDGAFNRIQFTPDLLPSDVTGVSVWDRNRSEFEFKPGPIFANIVVGDEINRASPKTQSALLEAMEERQVTSDGMTRQLGVPFMVVATQNPLEHEGTYPLPEAQLDRFMMRVVIGYPSRQKELEILDTHGVRSTFLDLQSVLTTDEVQEMVAIARGVKVSQSVKTYIVDLVEGTRNHSDILLGASPRSALFLQRLARARAASQGREYVTPDDIKALAVPVLEHRMSLRPEAQMRGETLAEIINQVMTRLRVPGTTSRLAT
ncbi:MAG: MoxR family ATPase [Acidimicrobiia bacterium]|nr:MoxR family ATPase [Acidimicrobiia bacterium]